MLLNKLPQKSMAINSEHYSHAHGPASWLQLGGCGLGSSGWLSFTLCVGWDWLYTLGWVWVSSTCVCSGLRQKGQWLSRPCFSHGWCKRHKAQTKPHKHVKFSAHFTSTDIPLAKIGRMAKSHISGVGQCTVPTVGGHYTINWQRV